MNMCLNFINLLCFSHTLQLSINNAVSEIEGMNNIITKYQKIVSHYHQSVQSGQWLYAQHRQLKRDERRLIMSVSKRLTFTH